MQQLFLGYFINWNSNSVHSCYIWLPLTPFLICFKYYSLPSPDTHPRNVCRPNTLVCLCYSSVVQYTEPIGYHCVRRVHYYLVEIVKAYMQVSALWAHAPCVARYRCAWSEFSLPGGGVGGGGGVTAANPGSGIIWHVYLTSPKQGSAREVSENKLKTGNNPTKRTGSSMYKWQPTWENTIHL